MKLRFFSFGPGRRFALATVASACFLAFPAAVPSSALAAAAPPAATSAATPSAPPMSTVGLLSSVPAPAIAARAWVTIDVTSDQILAEER